MWSLLPEQSSIVGPESMWMVGSLHWPAQVLTLIGGRWSEEFSKLTPFNPAVRYLKEAFDAREHASCPLQMIPTTKSHKFSHCYKISESAIISVEIVEDSEACRLGWDSKNVPIGNLGPECSCTREHKSRLKIVHCLPWPPSTHTFYMPVHTCMYDHPI